VALDGPFNSLIMTSTLFLGNTAQRGGGLWSNNNSAGSRNLILNSLFARNGATNAKGGAHLQLENPGVTRILHTTFADPVANPRAAIVNITGTLGITDSIIVSHSVGISGTGGVVREDYNLLLANGFNTLGTVNIGGHSLGVSVPGGDPRFINPAADNYHLGPLSAAIDRGSDAGIAFDIDGDARPIGAGFDIGYDEALWRVLFLPLIRR
jgi:hypothetical protein